METQGIGIDSQVLTEASNTLKVNSELHAYNLGFFLNHSLFSTVEQS